jgi:cytochrome c556
MKRFSKKALALTGLVIGLGTTPVALSHLNPDEFPQSYRQSLFAILGANFGPMSSMVKGEIPWDTARFKGFADDLATATTLDYMRGFPDGSDSGTTRAKPAIWSNKADFEAKLKDLRTEAQKLATAAGSGDQDAIVEQFKATGGTCKACHDDYKSKDYLN